MTPHPETWLRVTPAGLYCVPGDFHIDPARAVARAVITHAHSDHARPGHGAVLASAETLMLMRARLGAEEAGRSQRALAWHEPLQVGDVRLTLVPSGHVLGAAQIVLDHASSRVVISGDYKPRPDPTCLPFEPVPCDLFVTEATFALPVFRHPPAAGEIARLLASLRLFPDRTHLVGCYALGKCQRLIGLLRQAGYDAPIYLHGALLPLTAIYEQAGVFMGAIRPATAADKATLRGALVLAPPSAAEDRWARRLTDPVLALASGWMRVRQQAKRRGVELPLVISDHADWDELLATPGTLGCAEVWVTHGREEALIHALGLRGMRGRALSLIGRAEEDGGEAAEATAAEAMAAGATTAGATTAPGMDPPP